MGISKANSANLFQLFGKLKQKDATVNKEGIGLGLYIVRRMATQLGGNINVESTEGKFTRFVLTLPVNQFFWKIKEAHQE